jgi:hypothetical protein
VGVILHSRDPRRRGRRQRHGASEHAAEAVTSVDAEAEAQAFGRSFASSSFVSFQEDNE